ncbi:2-haloacid dehalogenase [Rhizobiales bacterium GAS191]|jgi:2-haloacid dehalogenase|nr:2-haloacid dehalogenase [Rhizobiales bacterium GAS191]SED06026.1 2-haloacid dehalogenase [Rhizobiales bacterium GAS188]
MRAIDTVVFDIGNVLLDWNPRYLYRKIFADEDRMEWFLANICTPAWNLEQDRGRSFADAVGLLTERNPEWAQEIRAFDERWEETIAGEIQGSLQLLARLKRAGVPIYAITNFSYEKYLQAAKRFAFFADFDGVVVSGRERLLKPDAAIYRLFLERYGVEASRSLFVDDSLTNVEGARRVGMNAVQFRDAEGLAADLASFGVLA